MKYWIIGLVFICSQLYCGYVRSQERILLIPLDDRPPCLQFPEEMGNIAGYEVVTPPEEWLGRYTRAGDSDKIIEWLKMQDISLYEALIVSADMLAYGGLVASREHRVKEKTAEKRLSVLRDLHARYPGVPIYLNSVIMRLAPTATTENETFRARLESWARQSDRHAVPDKSIPASVLDGYRKSRERNYRINRAAVKLVADGVARFLILSQDDAHPDGMHIHERDALGKLVEQLNVEDRVRIQPGADEISMVLLSRFISETSEKAVRVYVDYSSEKMREKIMPFEDKPLDEAVGDYVSTCGGRRVGKLSEADLVIMVYTSRNDLKETGRYREKLRAWKSEGYKMILVDIDPVGDVQGGSENLGRYLVTAGILPELYAYASWNTSGNTLGTGLAQGYTYYYSCQTETHSVSAGERRTAQQWFLWHRWLNDFVYNGVVRNTLLKKIAPLHWSSALTDSGKIGLEEYGKQCVEEYILELKKESGDTVPVENLSLTLPWNRLFEAEVDYVLTEKQ